MTLTLTQILILLAVLPIGYYYGRWEFKRGYQSRKNFSEAVFSDTKWFVEKTGVHAHNSHIAHLARERLLWIDEGRSDPVDDVMRLLDEDGMDESESYEEEDQLREAEEISEEQGVKDLVGEAPVATLTIGDSK